MRNIGLLNSFLTSSSMEYKKEKTTEDKLKFIKDLWTNNNFIKNDLEMINYLSKKYKNEIEDTQSWEAYEDYMEAKIIEIIPEIQGKLLVKFPAETSENNRLHTHPQSGRIIHVLKGSGEFIYVKNHTTGMKRIKILPGNIVYMPRGVLHTFKSFEKGMLVISEHYPFMGIDGETAIVYPKENKYCI